MSNRYFYIESLTNILNSQCVDDEDKFMKFCEEAKDDSDKADAIQYFMSGSITGNPFDEGLGIDDLYECLSIIRGKYEEDIG